MPPRVRWTEKTRSNFGQRGRMRWRDPFKRTSGHALRFHQLFPFAIYNDPENSASTIQRAFRRYRRSRAAADVDAFFARSPRGVTYVDREGGMRSTKYHRRPPKGGTATKWFYGLHEYRRDPGSRKWKIVGENPYI